MTSRSFFLLGQSALSQFQVFQFAGRGVQVLQLTVRPHVDEELDTAGDHL